MIGLKLFFNKPDTPLIVDPKKENMLLDPFIQLHLNLKLTIIDSMGLNSTKHVVRLEKSFIESEMVLSNGFNLEQDSEKVGYEYH